VIDLDLEKFFDRVNHDKLMGQIAKRVEDKRLLKLVRAFLNAGVMENGLVSPSVEGTRFVKKTSASGTVSDEKSITECAIYKGRKQSDPGKNYHGRFKRSHLWSHNRRSTYE
jgi:retron-type reverse transcriptase